MHLRPARLPGLSDGSVTVEVPAPPVVEGRDSRVGIAGRPDGLRPLRYGVRKRHADNAKLDEAEGILDVPLHG
jgi:hypothetical protein